MNKQITYLNQKQAQDGDQELMSSNVGYSLDILMELAGQSVAHVLHHINKKYQNNKIKNILIVCGPGNNGGDGIVAARHLSHYNQTYSPTILMLKPPTKEFFENQLSVCKQYQIPIKELSNEINTESEKSQEQVKKLFDSYDMIIDALFGFSFKPPIKPPSDTILEGFKQTTSPILSVDIPSGWDVEQGNNNKLFDPKYLISLTLPKEGTKQYKGKHFVGGRFVPTQIAQKYKWEMPIYKDNDTFVELE